MDRNQKPAEASPAAEPGDATEGFVPGLSIEHLNPPEIEAFFGGLPRRAAGYLADLDRRAPTEELVERLNKMIDRCEALVERLQSVGYALEAEAEQPGGTGRQLEAPPLAEPVQRLEAASVEVVKRLAGIPSVIWRSDDQLLQSSREAVAAVAATLRSLGPAVASANQQVPVGGDDPPADPS